MSRKKFLPIIATLVLGALAPAVNAQNSGPPGMSSSAGSASEPIRPTLRVQLVLSRFEGDRKLGSLPYTFVLTPNSQNPVSGAARLRMGVDVPVPKPASAADTSIQYQNVGTNIDVVNVRELAGGRYQFDVNVQNSTALPAADGAKGSPPLFRRFDYTFNAVLRDGQTMQTVASTDPVSGEVIKIDVTLNVVR